jgi:hypothetical protein
VGGKDAVLTAQHRGSPKKASKSYTEFHRVHTEFH